MQLTGINPNNVIKYITDFRAILETKMNIKISAVLVIFIVFIAISNCSPIDLIESTEIIAVPAEPSHISSIGTKIIQKEKQSIKGGNTNSFNKNVGSSLILNKNKFAKIAEVDSIPDADLP